ISKDRNGCSECAVTLNDTVPPSGGKARVSPGR
ncbi:unnamed protein product, partial [marine sediment metagenome]